MVRRASLPERTTADQQSRGGPVFKRMILFFVGAFAVLGCATNRPKSGSEQFEIYRFVTQPVIDRFAENLVKTYRPAEEGRNRAMAGYYGGVWDVSYNARHAVYSHIDYQWGWSDFRPIFLGAVKVFGRHPVHLRALYDANVGRVFTQAIAYAQSPVTGSWHRPAYTRSQVSEMLSLYAVEADTVALYFCSALKDRYTYKKLAAIEKKGNKIWQSKDLKEKERWKQYEALQDQREKLQTELRSETGLPFDESGFRTYCFGLRRLHDGGPALLRTMIEIVEDAAKRARDTARFLA